MWHHLPEPQQRGAQLPRRDEPPADATRDRAAQDHDKQAAGPSEKSAAVEALERQAGKASDAPAAEGEEAEEAHADGEQGKPTARDATGRKMEGFAEKDGATKDAG
jgi:hypothetical protein